MHEEGERMLEVAEHGYGVHEHPLPEKGRTSGDLSKWRG